MSMKSYLRIEPKKCVGVIASPKCSSIYDFSGNLAISGGVQDVTVWNLRYGSQIASMRPDEPNYPYSCNGEVCCLADCGDKSRFMTGYSNGDIVVFNYVTKSLVSTMHGHTAAVICIAVDKVKTGIAASGSADTSVIIWDLVALAPLTKLSGHKDAITGLDFLYKGTQPLLVTVSKDTLLKVWDLDSSVCIQTVVGHRSEIWSVIVVNRTKVITGCTDDMLRGFRVSDIASEGKAADVGDADTAVLEYYGCVRRPSSGTDRCSSLSVNSSTNMLAAQSNGKVVEIFRIRNEADSLKKMKRRAKRQREKSNKQSSETEVGGWNDYSAEAEEDADDNEEDADESEVQTTLGASDVIFSDEVEFVGAVRCNSKIKGFSFKPSASHSATDSNDAMVTLINNSIELYSLSYKVTGSALSLDSTKASIVDLHGHRSDIRAVAISSDNTTIATCSNEGIKLWSTKTFNCLRTCESGLRLVVMEISFLIAEIGYGVSIAFAPGSRYVINGTKDGYVKIIDTTSGNIVIDENAHPNCSVWAIAVRPDGKGFMTGSTDKIVKFWEFAILGGALSAQITRQLQMTSEILCLRYSPTKQQDKLLLAVGLLDCTVKVFFDDSLKFMLSLFGHKLPVLCLDISYDSALLVSGSADKTVKIWGLDFGDCHRSLIAHEDSVTSAKFQPNTHYFFTTGKDGMVKYWDADRFEQIQFFPGHVSSVWGLDISSEGNMCVSVGQDRSIRVWERGEDLVFIEEERERALEATVDKSASHQSDVDGALDIKQSVESIKGGESLLEALELSEAEIVQSNLPAYKPNPIFLGLTPYKYFARSLRMIKAADLENALLVMPFHYLNRFVKMLLELSKRGIDVELCSKAATHLIRTHFLQLTTSQQLHELIEDLGNVLKSGMMSYQQAIGSNIAALKYLKASVDSKKTERMSLYTLEAEQSKGTKRAVEVTTTTKSKRKSKKQK